MRGQSLHELEQQLSDRDLVVLRDLERFRLLTTRHLQRLHFDRHATTQAATRATSRALLRLRDLALVTPLERRVGGVRRGSASFVWQLGALGERLLRYQRGQPQRRRYLEPSLQFAQHTLAVANLAVGITETARRTPDLTLETLTTEPANWLQFVGPHGEARWLKPDLYVVTSSIDDEGTFEEHTYLEVDLGTEHRPRILTKSKHYADYAATGRYQAQHGVFPRVVWISEDSERRQQLRSTIDSSALRPHDLFEVTSLDQYLAELSRFHP